MKRIFFPIVVTVCVCLSGCLNPVNVSNKSAGTTYYDESTNTSYLVNPNYTKVSRIDDSRELVGDNMTDGSGKVEVAVWVSYSTGAHPSVICNVPSDYVCVGGGAYADYGDGWGALLTESRPNSLTGWAGSSKDHIKDNVHVLKVYAVGMKLSNIDPAVIRKNMIIRSNISQTAQHPQTSVSLPEGYTLIGGGARVDYGSNWGNMLVSSYPMSSTTWNASSKDHIECSPAYITAYVVGIKSTIPNFGELQIIQKEIGTEGPVEIGKIISNANCDSNYVVTCVGGKSTYGNGWGRMLFGLEPLGDYVKISSKDHIKQSSGFLTGYLVEIRKK